MALFLSKGSLGLREIHFDGRPAAIFRQGSCLLEISGRDAGAKVVDQMADDAFAVRVTTLGALADPVRRALYRFVSDQTDAVSRDQAADGVEVARHTAKFHLDRLVDEGLLVTEFRRLTGRTGPGAGRPAKLYRRSRKEVWVSVPSRRYDLAGQVLSDAVERALRGVPMAEAVDQAADNAARIVIEAWPPRTDGELESIAEVLGELGYEPRIDDSGGAAGGSDASAEADLRLGNCPFERLAADHRELVCGLNLTFVSSVGERLGCSGATAVAHPRGAGCCVRVVSRDPDET
jgi:predicted ArsR family transcriptional regulator